MPLVNRHMGDIDHTGYVGATISRRHFHGALAPKFAKPHLRTVIARIPTNVISIEFAQRSTYKAY